MTNIKDNTLYTEDNLAVMNGMNSECVDLIYLDPPFNSKRVYVAPIGSKATGASFSDIWTWDDVDEQCLERLYDTHPCMVDYIDSIRKIHGKAMASYLTFMAQRIVEMHRILKSTGCIYLHCDPTASHYLKVVMDKIFGKNNFKNEIVWHYRTYQGKVETYYPKKHDVILSYLKSKNGKLIKNLEYKGNYEDTVDYKRWKQFYVNGNEILYGNHPATDSRFTAYLKKWTKEHGREPKKNELIYQCKGYVVDDVWTDIQALDPKDKTEKTGYKTQKPLSLLQRIIRASSNEGDVVFDPFCGCATTCVAAQQLNRQWIGVDIELVARDLVVDRLKDDAGLFTDFVHLKKPPIRTDIKQVAMNKNELKKQLYKKQSKTCNGCTNEYLIKDFHIDHILPRKKGGQDNMENLQLLCGHCNTTKGDRTMEYLMAKLQKKAEAAKRVSY